MVFVAGSPIPSLAYHLRLRQLTRVSTHVTNSGIVIAPVSQWRLAAATLSHRSIRRGLATNHSFARSRLNARPIDSRRNRYGPNDEDDEGMRAGKYQRKIGPFFWGCSIFGAVTGIYIAYYYATFQKALRVASELDLSQNADVSDRWKDRTRNFDEEVDFSEKLILMKAKRRRLARQAVGNVLEVSCGTGRNVDLYDLRPFDPVEQAKFGRSRKTQITAITFNDQSEVMLEHAEDKFAKHQASLKPVQRFTGPVNYVVGDAGIRGIIKRPEGGFDTIIQTMGVCSMVNAPGFLRTLGQLCRQPDERSKWLPQEADDGKGGKILLLEHGRSSIGFINRILDNGAKMHANHYGCWWNKDVPEAIKQSGLEIEKVRRYNFGTTYEYTLRPPLKAG